MPVESLRTALAALSVAFCAVFSLSVKALLLPRVAAKAADALSSSSSAWLNLTTSPLSCARCWTRPVASHWLTSPLMVSAPSTAAVRVGTAMTAASRHRTRQLTRANRDRAEPGRFGCGWVERTMLAGGGSSGAPACDPACAGASPDWGGNWAGNRTGLPSAYTSPPPDAGDVHCGEDGFESRPAFWPADAGRPRPSPAAAPPASSPEPPPSACPPLTAPAVPAVSPGFVPDRLRTTFAPRIGKPGQDACRATTAEAGQHTHPSGRGGSTPHSRVTKRVRTYNHLLGGRHGAFASKPARSSSGRLPRSLTGS